MYQLDLDSLNVQNKYYSGEGVVCLCEFHNDHHPSMFVNLVEGNYYCFSCGAKGNIQSLLDVTGGTKKYVPYNLQSISNKNNDEWVKLLSLGTAVNDKYLLERGFTPRIIEKYELLSDEDRVVIPLKKGSEVVGLKVRIKTKQKGVKYLTFGEQPTYISTFDIKRTDPPKNVIITEGMFGLMRYEMFGVDAITPLSVNRAVGLKKLIENYKHNYFIAFDPDNAGYLNAAKLLYSCVAFGNLRALKTFFDVDTIEMIDFNIMFNSTRIYTETHWENVLLGLSDKDEYWRVKKQFGRFVKSLDND